MSEESFRPDLMSTAALIEVCETAGKVMASRGDLSSYGVASVLIALGDRLKATEGACSRATGLLEAQQPLVVAAVKLYDKVQSGESYSVEGKHHVVFDRDSGIDAFWNELGTYRKTLEAE